MGATTNIAWADATINFWTGCKKISRGCRKCYMFRDSARWKKDPEKITPVSDATINGILRRLTKPSMIFVNSWSDFCFAGPECDELRKKAWQVIRRHPEHIWMILTHRPEYFPSCLPSDWDSEYNKAFKNVWLGTTIEAQEYDYRIDLLLRVKANCYFVSAEPLLENITLTKFYDFIECNHCQGSGMVNHNHAITSCPNCNNGTVLKKKIDWLIVGGSSGSQTGRYSADPCNLEWIENIVKECKRIKLPVFVKQLGSILARDMKLPDRTGSTMMYWPEHLQIQQYPIQLQTVETSKPAAKIYKMEACLSKRVGFKIDFTEINVEYSSAVLFESSFNNSELVLTAKAYVIDGEQSKIIAFITDSFKQILSSIDISLTINRINLKNQSVNYKPKNYKAKH